MKYVVMGIIGLLAAFGGYTLTRVLATETKHAVVRHKTRRLKPCNCGAEHKMLGTNGHVLIVACEECGRTVEDEVDKAIERWNNGERDERYE